MIYACQGLEGVTHSSLGSPIQICTKATCWVYVAHFVVGCIVEKSTEMHINIIICSTNFVRICVHIISYEFCTNFVLMYMYACVTR